MGIFVPGNEQRKKFEDLKNRHQQSTIHILLKAAAEGDTDRVVETLHRYGIGEINVTDGLHERYAGSPCVLRVSTDNGHDVVLRVSTDNGHVMRRVTGMSQY